MKLMTYTAILSVLGPKYQSKPLLCFAGNLAEGGEGSEYQHRRVNTIKKKEPNKGEQEKEKVLGE